MISPKLPKILFGADYYPEQWTDDIITEDMKLMKKYRVNVVVLNVFSWAKLQKSEESFDFSWLDKIMDLLHENGIKVILATPTSHPPAWMAKKYPDIMRVTIDGTKMRHGSRANFCPNSPHYRAFSYAISERLAERYHNHPALILWHINNEYEHYCYCENCAEAFRQWLKGNYKSLEEVNKRWNTSFWGHTVYDWEEIDPPSYLNEIKPKMLGDRNIACFQGMEIDYRRFMSASVLACIENEKKAVKRFCPDIPVTNNLSGLFKPFDYFKWADSLDLISWDNYPEETTNIADVAFIHDLMRGLGDGRPFLIMEQAPNHLLWRNNCAVKRPGMVKLLLYQGLAHGAEGGLFFQWRQSIGGVEKFHGAMVPHAGHEKTRMGQELIALGKELSQLDDEILDSVTEAEVGLVFDWENWWAVECSAIPNNYFKYNEQVCKYYRAFYDLNILVDVISSNSCLGKYKVVVAPCMYMVNKKFRDRIHEFVKSGGTFITSQFSGLVDESDRIIPGGYPGAFRELLGIWVEEIDGFSQGMKNRVIIKGKIKGVKESYECGLMCDLLHCQGAEVLAEYGEDFYKGYPCITENTFGKGKAIYIATSPEDLLVKHVIEYVLKDKSIKAPLDVPEGVEVTQRKKMNKTFTFILNHNNESCKINLKNKCYDLISKTDLFGEVLLEAKKVLVLETSN